jgi:hypothetical protein
MGTSHTDFLNQLRDYVNEYVRYVVDQSTVVTPEVNDNLRRVIRELEELQKHPDQRQQTERATEGIGDQLARLRQLHAQAGGKQVVTRPHRTLMQSFQDYIDSEVAYLASIGSNPNREQINLLLGDIIGDLKALSLHPTEEQAERLAADLEQKRAQVIRLQRPWQQARGAHR